MVDREKAIKGLYEAADVIERYVPARYIGYAEQACYDALALLKEKGTTRWQQISPAHIYECEACGQNVMTDDIDAYKYCHGCGRKVTWDGAYQRP